LNLEDALHDAAKRLNNQTTLVRAVLSGRRRNMNPSVARIDIRPVQIREKVVLQLMSNDGIRMTTKNYEAGELAIPELLNSGFANILVETTTDSLSIRITKKGDALIHVAKVRLEQNLQHDKFKQRLLEPSDPFLIQVGISDHNGKVKPSKQDKFLQVEAFLRLLAPAINSAIAAGQLPMPTSEKPLEMVDLGCGHAYLTFGAHQYLMKEKLPVHVLGIDRREESRIRNAEIARKLEISKSMEFRAQEIAQAESARVDVVIALHACDTATDDALAWAVQNDAKLILAAPCCHHDLQTQMKTVPDPWGLITRYGLLEERLGDILTDALRAQILRLLGYRVEAVEFIADEHTPRNLMIRAVKTGAKAETLEIERYQQLLAEWQVRPALALRLETELLAAGVAPV
jgi:protein-tyrosine-phosphatase